MHTTLITEQIWFLVTVAPCSPIENTWTNSALSNYIFLNSVNSKISQLILSHSLGWGQISKIKGRRVIRLLSCAQLWFEYISLCPKYSQGIGRKKICPIVRTSEKKVGNCRFSRIFVYLSGLADSAANLHMPINVNKLRIRINTNSSFLLGQNRATTL